MFNMKQNNQCSWAARLRKFSALCLVLVATSNAWADDQVTAFVKPGETKQLAIQLKNATDYTAFQMTIKLPTGLVFADANPVLTDRKDASHKLEFNKEDASTMKVVSYSYEGNTGNEAFSGNAGDLLIINVTAADDYVAKNIAFSDVIFVEKSGLSGVDIDTHVAGLLGDVNMDTFIDAQDASLIQQNVAKMIANDDPNYEIIVADVNSDGAVDAQDASLIKEFVAKMRSDFNE